MPNWRELKRFCDNDGWECYIAHKKTPGDLSLSEFAGFVSCGVVCEIYAVGLEQAVIFPVVMFT